MRKLFVAFALLLCSCEEGELFGFEKAFDGQRELRLSVAEKLQERGFLPATADVSVVADMIEIPLFNFAFSVGLVPEELPVNWQASDLMTAEVLDTLGVE